MKEAEPRVDSVICIFKNCQYEFSNYKSFHSHCRDHHNKIDEHELKLKFKGTVDDINDINENSSEFNCEDGIESHDNDLLPTNDNDETVNSTFNIKHQTSIQNHYKEVLDFYMKQYIRFKNMFHIPKYQCDEIFQVFQEFLRKDLHGYRLAIPQMLQTYDLDLKYFLPFSNHLEASSIFTMVHKDLKYNSSKLEYYESSQFFVEPIQTLLGHNDCGIPEVYHYVPILEMLKALMNRSDIREQILKPKVSTDGKIRSYLDGSIYKSNRILNRTNTPIILKFYIDEFEVANPLGEMKGGYKLTGVYYQVQ